MGRWDNYDSLTPSEHDLSQDWRKMPVLPPLILTKFLYAPEREPDKPRIDLADGMVRDMRDELKDGNAVGVNSPVLNALSKRAVSYAVKSLVKEMEQRTGLRLAIAPYDEYSKWPVTLDDKEGLAPPEVRFCIVPR